MNDETAERQRIVRCLTCGTQDAAVQLRPGYAQMCGHCGRPMVVCDADVRGCGSTPAKDEVVEETPPPTPPKEETWRDRPPLL